MKTRILILSLIAFALTGCETGDVSRSDVPVGWKAFVSDGNFITFVIPVTMEDGTKCVITKPNGTGGGGISCDWSAR